ncbi:Ribosomal RNA small subunit methyltransferase I (fragment), partial [Rhodococcus sp. AW25M09]
QSGQFLRPGRDGPAAGPGRGSGGGRDGAVGDRCRDAVGERSRLPPRGSLRRRGAAGDLPARSIGSDDCARLVRLARRTVLLRRVRAAQAGTASNLLSVGARRVACDRLLRGTASPRRVPRRRRPRTRPRSPCRRVPGTDQNLRGGQTRRPGRAARMGEGRSARRDHRRTRRSSRCRRGARGPRRRGGSAGGVGHAVEGRLRSGGGRRRLQTRGLRGRSRGTQRAVALSPSLAGADPRSRPRGSSWFPSSPESREEELSGRPSARTRRGYRRPSASRCNGLPGPSAGCSPRESTTPRCPTTCTRRADRR